MAKMKAKAKAKPASKSTTKSSVKKAKIVSKKMKPVAAKQRIDVTNVKTATEKQTKSQLIQFIAEQTGLTRNNVSDTFKVLAACIHGQMRKKGSGEISIPETGIKVRRLRKPATKTRTMISPFTGQEITVKAKPARNVVKVSALKSLKESVNQ